MATAQANLQTLLHGDFWPGNILWKDGQLVAVVDWGEYWSDLGRDDITANTMKAAYRSFVEQTFE